MNDYSLYIAQLYDRQEQRQGADAISTAFYNGSDWLNFGYWRSDTATVAEACEALVNELLALSPPAGGLVLDVGCGKGMTARHLRRHFNAEDIFGINISREHLARCQVNAPDSTFFEMDATSMEFPDGSFEYVISVEAAFHFCTRAKFLEEAFRVLKPGGRFALSDILTDGKTPHQPSENRIGDLETYRRLFEDIGFTEIRIVDATQQCSVGFHDAVLRCFKDRVEKGEATSFVLQNVSSLLKGRLANKSYVLAGGVRP